LPARPAKSSRSVFGGSEVGVEVVELRHHADLRPRLAGARRHRLADQRDRAGIRRGQAEAAAQGGGLAGAVGAEQAVTLAALQFKVEPGDDFAAVVGFVQGGNNQRAHASSFRR
jgi:hypothetical protein